ncbi:MAG TPA: hypothetical protein VFP84_34605 [Kofleriaceae bacterium]|nr:hypothetical protein [Kofleriaceae bacterium]
MVGADYGDNLRSSLDAARKQILDACAVAVAMREQAAITLSHAEQALSVAEGGLDRNQRDLAIAYVINNIAVQGGALIQSADRLANLSSAGAASADLALSVAGTSIKTLASAFDTLADSVAGVSAIASNDDYGSVMARSAAKSEAATDSADNTVERLKAASLVASIQSARSVAAAAMTSVSAVGSEIQDLVDRATALLAAVQQRVSDGMKQRAAAAQAERAAQMTYRQAKIDSEAYDDGATNMDALVNGGLTVTATATLPTSTPPAPSLSTTTPSASTTSTAATSTVASSPARSLTANYTVTGASSDRCYFFALPDGDAPGFSYNDAKTAVIESEVNPGYSGWTPTIATPAKASPSSTTQTYTVQITVSQTVAGAKPIVIAAGQTYRVFAYRVPQGGPYATNASDLSSPSRPIQVLNAIPNLSAYQASIKYGPDPAGAALFTVDVKTSGVALDSVPRDTSIMEYRAFAWLEDVYHAVQNDVEFLTRMLPPSSYKSIRPTAGGAISFAYQEGDTDAYGDIVTRGINYQVIVMVLPRGADTVASAFLPAVPVTWSAPTPAPPAPAPPGSAPVLTTPVAGKPAPDNAAPDPGQSPAGPGVK